MKSQAKLFASLSSALLARKGTARPAMKPHGYTASLGAADELGWKDLGFESALPMPADTGDDALATRESFEPSSIFDGPQERAHARPRSPVHRQQAQISSRFAQVNLGVGEGSLRQVGHTSAIPKAAFTLRLERQRHLRLRLASAVTGRSAQKLVTQALDEFLASMPNLDALAEQAPHAGHRAGRKDQS